MLSFIDTSACKKTLAMHGYVALFIGYFPKPTNGRYKLALRGQLKIEIMKCFIGR
jgi:hypothetical protein